jgi:hypothetical protein
MIISSEFTRLGIKKQEDEKAEVNEEDSFTSDSDMPDSQI